MVKEQFVALCKLIADVSEVEGKEKGVEVTFVMQVGNGEILFDDVDVSKL